MTYRPTSLTARLAQISAEDDAREAEGWTVFRLVTDESFWNERGYFTAADLDAMLDAECERERRKSAMAGWDEDDSDWQEQDRLQREQEDRWYADWQREQDEMAALVAENARYTLYNHYQPGWA